MYLEKKETFKEIQKTFGNGTDQTPINFMLHQENVDTKFLPYEFNMTCMFQKEILDENLTFTNLGWVYHYCAIPDNHNADKTLYWMQKTYEHLYGELND